jgi:pimeloyl-ACP methyl ester carboxylesterase
VLGVRAVGEAVPFGLLLKRHRVAGGLTHEALAERAGLSVRAISDLERGVNRAPRRETLRRLTEALQLTPEQRAAFDLAVRPPAPSMTPAAPISPAAVAAPQPTAWGLAGGGQSFAGGPEGRRGLQFEIRYARRADGATTAYGLTGVGPALIMPPGFLSHLEWWGTAPGVGAFLRPLAAHRTVVLYDRHGCGLSDRDRTDFTAEDDLRDLEAVAAAVGASTVDQLGISWGALPVVTYAARHPERVRRLVLYGASLAGHTESPGLPERAVASQVTDRQAALAALRRADLELYVRAVAMRAFPSGADEATFRSFLRIFQLAAPVEMQERLETVRFGADTLLAQIQAPTLVLHRRGDQMASFANGQYYARHIPRTRFLPLDGEAHFPWVGDWQSVVTPILDFLLEEETARGG